MDMRLQNGRRTLGTVIEAPHESPGEGQWPPGIGGIRDFPQQLDGLWAGRKIAGLQVGRADRPAIRDYKVGLEDGRRCHAGTRQASADRTSRPFAYGLIQGGLDPAVRLGGREMGIPRRTGRHKTA